jgi:hypothetical protein
MTLNLRRINDRYTYEAELTAGKMFGAGATADELREQRLTIPPNLPQPMPIHRAIMQAVDQVLTVGLTDSTSRDVAMPLRTAMRLLRRLEPVMMEHLATVPEDECFRAMRVLAAGITQLADSVENGSDARPALVRPTEPAVAP